MEKTVFYLKNLKEDVLYAIEQEESLIQVNLNDVQNIEEALKEIKGQQVKFETFHDTLIGLSNAIRKEQTEKNIDLFLVDEMLALLKRTFQEQTL